MKTLGRAGNKETGMIGGTILHHEILEKLGEVRLLPRSGRDETRSNSIA